MKTFVAAGAVIGAAVVGGGAAALTAGHHGPPPSGPTTGPSVTVSSSPSASVTSPGSSATGKPAADPTSSSGIACKGWDQWDWAWVSSPYTAPATEGGDPAAIQTVQRMLNYIAPTRTCLRDDGVWTAATGDAIKAFQRDHELEPVNQAGPKTYAALQQAVVNRINTTGARLYVYPTNPSLTSPQITSVATARTALPGADEDFITFIGTDGAKAAASATKECHGQGADSVDAYDSSGFALGAATSCGGEVVIWSKQSGAWKAVLGTQSEWACADLERLHVPSRMYGALTTCYDGNYSRTYGHH